MKNTPDRLNQSALIVIDMQRYFLKEGARAYLDPPKYLIKNVVSLIKEFRRANLPIVFTKHAHTKGDPTGQMGRWWKDDLPWNGDKDSELIEDIKPTQGEIVITKTRYSALEESELDLALKKEGIGTLVICGVMTNLCVETTARHAFMKDFHVIVVDDACATKSEEYHRASILNLSYGFADIVTVDDILKCGSKEVRK